MLNDENFFPMVKQHYNGLYSFLLAGVGNKPDADDLLQIVGMRAYAARHSLRDTKKIKSWLYAIARNEIKRFYTEKKRVIVLNPYALENVLAYYDDETLNRLVITDFIQDLPNPWPRLLYLHLYGELTAKEIAVMFALPYAMVRKRLYRIKQKLRIALKEGGNEEVTPSTPRI